MAHLQTEVLIDCTEILQLWGERPEYTLGETRMEQRDERTGRVSSAWSRAQCEFVDEWTLRVHLGKGAPHCKASLPMANGESQLVAPQGQLAHVSGWSGDCRAEQSIFFSQNSKIPVAFFSPPICLLHTFDLPTQDVFRITQRQEELSLINQVHCAK